MSEGHPFDEAFKNPSSRYKYQKRGSNRILSVPNSSDRALANFQPIANRALKIASEYDIRIKEHPRKSPRGAMLIDLITIFP
jgi:hypothetical protein